MRKRLGATGILLILAMSSFIVLLIATFKLQLYPLIVASWWAVGILVALSLITFIVKEE